MYIPKRLTTKRTFIKKALHFFKYYPRLISKDPKAMLLKTVIKIEKDVMNANSMSDLELLSDNIRLALYPNLDKQLCQVQMVDEEYRFIVYEPIKFLGSNSNEGEVAILYDLVYIRDNMFR